MKNVLNFPKTTAPEPSTPAAHPSATLPIAASVPAAASATDVISKAEWSRHVRLKLELAATTKSWNEAALTLARQAAAMIELEETLAIEEKRFMERLAAGAQIEDGGRVDAKASKKDVRPTVN